MAEAVDDPFLMPIQDVFPIQGRGTVVAGKIERGKIKAGEEVEIVGPRETRKAVVVAIEMIKFADQRVRDVTGNVGLLLNGIDQSKVERGMILAKPGSVTWDGLQTNSRK